MECVCSEGKRLHWHERPDDGSDSSFTNRRSVHKVTGAYETCMSRLKRQVIRPEHALACRSR